MIFELSFDDASKYDHKLVGLLDLYDLPATIFAPVRCEIGLDFIRSISNRYEIGCHTVTHPADLKVLTGDFLKFEIQSAKEMLEVSLEKKITSFCYPRGRFNDTTVAVVQSAGFVSARTTKVLETKRPTDLFRKPTTIHAYQRKEYNGVAWDKLAVDLFDLAQKTDGYYHLWGHSAEIQKYAEWDKLEAVFAYLQKKGMKK